MHERPVVTASCLLLIFRRYGIKAALKQLLELGLLLHDVLGLHQALLEVSFDDAPHGFDRVELRGVSRQKHNFNLQLCSKQFAEVVVVSRGIIEN